MRVGRQQLERDVRKLSADQRSPSRADEAPRIAANIAKG